MLPAIRVRTCGRIVEVSGEDGGRVPAGIEAALTAQLTYIYRSMNMDGRRELVSGRKNQIIEEPTALYYHDAKARLVCGVGLTARICTVLKNLGCPIIREDIQFQHSRPDRFTYDWDNVLRNFDLRARQPELLMSMTIHPYGIIDAATGFGKSYMFQVIPVFFPKARIVITTYRTDLVNKLRGELSRTIPNVGQVGAGKRAIRRVTVATADSLHHIDPEDCDILLAEEGHEFVPVKRARKLAAYSQARLYCLTATPEGRFDGADIRLESIFGPRIFTLTFQEALELGLVVPITVDWLRVGREPKGWDPAISGVPRKRWGIWRNQVRNQVIADAANKFGPDEQVLIMVTTFEHAVYLRHLLPDFELCYAETPEDRVPMYREWGILQGELPDMTPARREQMREDFQAGKLKKVIATDIWSTGVDFRPLSVLIRAEGGSSRIRDGQIPGRVCRLSPETGKQGGLVLDCWDQWDYRFANDSGVRYDDYELKGWKQIGGHGR
jgi:hypothetical protein